MTTDRRCWCGSEQLARFDSRYLGCRDCESLIVAELPATDLTRVTDEAADFYGRRYWFEHQRELGQPDLEARSVSDLPERCLHWLRTLLAYRLPPGRALEIGCAHGGFVGLLRDVGFDATGLELSPWVADYARRTFDVPVLCGPLEGHKLERGSLDVLVALDVLEHLTDPVAMMRRAVALLKDDGLLLIQTPCRPAGKSREELAAAGHRFLEMLLPDEHVQLFSERGLRQLLKRSGAVHLAFEPAIFAHYDMFVAASPRPLARRSAAELRAFLSATARRRRILALLDLREIAGERSAAFARADADRVDRQRQIDELHRILESAEEDRRKTEELLRREARTLDEERRAAGERLEELEEKHGRQQDAFEDLRVEHERDQKALDELRVDNERQREALEAATVEQSRRQEELEALRSELDRQRAAARRLAAERERHLRSLDELRHSLEASRREQAASREAIAELQGRVADLERRDADSQRALAEARGSAGELRGALGALEAAHRELGRELAELAELHRRAVRTIAAQDAAKDAADDALATLGGRLARIEKQERALREVAEEHRTSRIYRALVYLGRWRPLDEKLARALEIPAAEVADRTRFDWRPGRAVAELPGSSADAPVIAVDLTALLPGGENGGAKLVATGLVAAMRRLEPRWLFVLLTTAACHHELAALEAGNVRRVRVRPEPGALRDLLHRQPVDLLLCPMTAPPFDDPRVPLVCVIHDLQYRAYPEFFSSGESAARDRDFRRAVERCERLITVSEFVRGTVLEAAGLAAERVVAVPNAVLQELPEPSAARIDEVLGRHRLEREAFLFYPANFWPHKNHRMLLTAFGLFRRRHPESGWKLVLSGADRPDPGPIRLAARRMGLGDAVVFPGFVPAADLSALLRSCAAMIFPSLYEGFGMPVIEAMAQGRPVLASAVTALPEVAADAALLFDPRKPEEIAAAIERIATERELRDALRAAGRRRSAEIGGPERMAAGYLEVVRQVLVSPRRFEDGLYGVHADGWTAPRFLVAYRGSETPRTLELELVAPPGSAAQPPALTAGAADGEVFRAALAGPRPITVRCELASAGGWIELAVEPAFVPAERGVSADDRDLGVKLQACRIVAPPSELAGLRPAEPPSTVDLLRGGGGG